MGAAPQIFERCTYTTPAGNIAIAIAIVKCAQRSTEPPEKLLFMDKISEIKLILIRFIFE